MTSSIKGGASSEAQAAGPAKVGGHQVLEAMLRQDSATGETKLDVTNPEMLAEFEAAWLQMKESLRPADAPNAGRPRKYVMG